MNKLLLAGCAALVLAGTPALAADTTHKATKSNPSVAAVDNTVDPALMKLTVRDLKGKDVYGSDGKDMAEIEDVVRSNGHLYAVLDVDHMIDVSDKDVVLPLNRLHMKNDKLTLDMTQDQLQKLEKWQKGRYETVKGDGPLSRLDK